MTIIHGATQPSEPISEIIVDESKWRGPREKDVIATLLEAWHAGDLERVERMIDNRTVKSLRTRAVVIVKRKK